MAAKLTDRDHEARVYPAAMSRPVLYGIIGGLAWFVPGIIVGHYVWT
ncbi:MAG: hypothetical protein M3386_07485 [Actinomycetota bacterium]|nr:hypothetical protein [Actinomycetota bacterium]